MEQNKRGRPCKKRREGSGRKPENVDPVSHASEDFENEVVQGICRELDIDSIGLLKFISFFVIILFLRKFFTNKHILLDFTPFHSTFKHH